MRPLRVAFADFWPGFNPHDNPLIRALSTTQEVSLVPPREARLLIFSVFGDQHTTFAGTKVHFTGENVRPPWDLADFCIGFDHLDETRYLRFPLFALLALQSEHRGRRLPPGPPWVEREFCLFLYSHPGAGERRQLFERLSAYRRVTSPGRYLQNTTAPELADANAAGWHWSKLQYQRGFRFTLACENSSFPGYTTEKMYDALRAGTIPIYWGNPRVDEDFDPDSFINCHSFAEFDEVVEHVARVDRDEQLAAGYLAVRTHLVRPLAWYQDRLVEHLGRAAEEAAQGPGPKARRRAARLIVRRMARRAAGKARRALGLGGGIIDQG